MSMLSRALLALGLVATTLSLSPDGPFAWDEIEPTSDLRYHACYDSFQCARLKVPLDWQNTSHPGTVAIAIVNHGHHAQG